jgi:hypothetical protein
MIEEKIQRNDEAKAAILERESDRKHKFDKSVAAGALGG